MSYLGQRLRRRVRRGMSGLSSRPRNPGISKIALQGPPDWFRAMQGCSLGDDATTAGSPGAPTITDGTAQWQASLLSETQGIRDAQEEFTRRESMQRWVQIAATLAIPLSAAIWRAIFRGSRDSVY